MAGINKVILVGNLARDPEVRYSAKGAAIANITVATSEQWKDKETGQKQEKAEFHRIFMLNRLGDIAGEYLKKGSQVYIEGKLQTRKWQDNTGADRYTTEIVANEMQMLGSRSDGAGNGGQNQGGQAAPAQQQSPPQSQGHPSPHGNFDDFDGEPPF